MHKTYLAALTLCALLAACGESRRENLEDAAEARREITEELREGDTADAAEARREMQAELEAAAGAAPRDTLLP